MNKKRKYWLFYRKKKTFSFSVILYFLLAPMLISAQQSKTIFDQYTIQDGLSHNTVNCIVQDSLGFMWFGTMDGLCRFDGNTFKVFRSIPDNANSLCHNLVKSICLDHKGGLWIGTAHGLSYFNIESNRFSDYYAQDSSNLSYNNIENVFCNSKGEIWVATQGGGLNMFNDSTNKFVQFRAGDQPGSLSNDNVHWIFEDNKGVMWFGTEGGGLNRLNTEISGFSFDFFQFEPEDGNYQALSCIRSIEQDFEGNIWVGTWGGGAGILKNKEFEYFRQKEKDSQSISDNRVISMLAASNKELWFGTEDGGLNRYRFENKTFEQIRMDRMSPFGLKSNNIKTIFEDRSKRIWLGTSGTGVFSFGLGESTFSIIPLKDKNSKEIDNQDIYAITGDKKSLWIGTNGGGLYQTDFSDNSNSGNYLSQELIFKNIALESEIVHALSFDHWGRLWVGTLGGGLSMIEFIDNSPLPQVTNFTIKKPDQNSVSYNDIRSLYHDKSGNLWIGTAGSGLDKLVIAKRGEYYFDHYKQDKNSKTSLSNNDVRAITEDISGNIWVGTAFGLNKLSIPNSNSKFKTFYSDSEIPGTLSGNWINSLFADKDGFLWIGTDAGLNRLDTKTNEIKVYTEIEGLVNNVVKAITGDEHGNLWITSVNGISMFNIKNETFYNFYESDGLLSNEFNSNALFFSPNKQILIGGTQGVNFFKPQNVLQHNQINALYITDFKLFNQSIKVGERIRGRVILVKDISLQKTLELKHNENSFSFEFAALDYSNAEKISYQYILEGFDRDWQETDAEHRYATYTNIGGGKYTYKVRAISGVPNDEVPVCEVVLHIHYPFWLQWWAFVCYFIILASIIYFIRKNNKNKAKFREDLRVANLEREKEHELNDLKQRFFMNISHELKTPLTLIMGPLESIQQDNILREKHKSMLFLVKRNAEILSRLISQMIDFSKQERGALKLHVEKVDMVSFVKYVMFSFQEEARRNEISFDIFSEQETLYAFIDREKMEKVIFNLLSNAFKYTPKGGAIGVTVQEERNLNRNLIIKIEDTGKGINPSQHQLIFERFYQVSSDDSETGTGIGLSLTKEMVELHYGKISVKSAEKKGSCFIVSIPINEKTFDDEIETSAPEQKYKTEENIAHERTIEEDGDSQKSTVLIVEDNYDLCDYLSIILAEKYKVRISYNGEDGLQKAMKIIPDIIISDVMMPKMDGITFCNSIKNDISVSHVPVLLLTAKSGKENVLSGFESGADDYLEKPFDTDILMAHMEALLENRKRVWQQIQKCPIGSNASKKMNKLDREFLDKLKIVIDKKMAEVDFSVEELGKSIGMSRTTLYRKVKGTTGMTAIEYIRLIRLNKAKELMQSTSFDHIYIAEKVGFKDVDYFKKCFKKQFGSTPE